MYNHDPRHFRDLACTRTLLFLKWEIDYKTIQRELKLSALPSTLTSFLPGNITVHYIGTWVLAAFHQRWEEGGLIDVEQQEDKHSLHPYLEEQAEKVGPPKTPSLLPSVIIERGAVFAILQSVFALSFLPVGHVKNHQEGRAGDEDQL